MANADTPFGARLTGGLDQADISGKTRAYTVLASDTTALFVGDFVKLTGTLGVGEDGLYHPVVTQAAATDEVVGFVTGFFATSDNLNQIYRTASTLRTVYVMDKPYVEFEMQTDGTGAVGDVGALVDITVGTGSTDTGVSAMELDQTSVGTGTQLRIVDMVQRPDNEVGANMKWVCIMNDQTYKGSTTI